VKLHALWHGAAPAARRLPVHRSRVGAPEAADVSGWQVTETLVDPERVQTLQQRLLLLLVVARTTMLLFATGMLWFLSLPGGASHAWLKFGLVVACIVALTGPVCRRHARREPLTDRFIQLQLLADVALLCYVFFETGGTSDNPFLVFFCVPVTLAAYALPPRRMAAVVAAVLGSLLLLTKFHGEAQVLTEAAHEVSEVTAIAMLTYFAYAVARVSRTHDREVAQAREFALDQRGQQALQTVAARAVDAVSSPLATMSVLVQEMEQHRMPDAERQAALGVLGQQIALCKTNLSKLLESVGHPRGDVGQRSDIAEVLRAAASECELMNPRLTVVFERPLIAPPAIVDERSLFDAFVLMIQHFPVGAAGDAAVRIDARWDTREIRVKLSGPATTLPDPDTGGGSVELAAALLGRLGGTLGTRSRDEGLCLRVRIPIDSVGIGVNPVVPSRQCEVDCPQNCTKR
jgi:two-component system sensor histidine kinase RegB